MSRSQTMEKFPDLIISPQRDRSSSFKSRTTINPTRSRRRSSGLGMDIRGDTGAPAVSTLEPKSPLLSPPLSPRSSANPTARVSKRRKARSLFRRWRNFSFVHTWVNPLLVVIVILSLYGLNPTPSNPLHQAIFLSYPLPRDSTLIPAYVQDGPETPLYYGKGAADFAFVAFYTVVLSFTREFLMQRLIRPMAIYGGIRSRSKQSRFMEQVYTAMYFSVFGPFGLYVMSRTPIWYFNTTAMYDTFPHFSHEGLFKAYYLLQASYWLQQAIVLCLQLEKPRKDFKELVAHHVVTLALIWSSYAFHFTHMGLAVYITHDISDFFLATAKTLHYLKSELTTYYFAFFLCVWVYLRHYLNLRLLFSILTTFQTVGPFDLNWETQQYKCRLSQTISFSLLAALQSINCIWLFFILRIAYNIVFEKVIEDVRSDDESELEEPKNLESHAGVADRNADVLANGVANGNANGKAKPSLATSSGMADESEASLRSRSNGQLTNGHAM